MEKPKLVHIVYSGLGGTADYILNLIRGDADKKAEHHLIFYGVEPVSEALLKQSGKIAFNVMSIRKKPGVDNEALQKLAAWLKQINPDAVTLHVNSLIYHLPKLLPANTKLLFVEHQANHLKTRKEWLWSILAQRKADAVVCLTPEYQGQLKAKLRFLFKTQKNTVISTGIVLSDYQKDKAPSDKIRFGMVSRINALKDHRTLLEAFKTLQTENAELHIAGDGDLLTELKEEFESSRIIFHGFVPQLEIPTFLGSLDVYVQASLGETSSIAIMQAQATGLPIIGSDSPGINSVLQDAFGLLVPPKNVEAMQGALKTFIESEEKRVNAGKAALEYAQENLSHIKMFDAYKDICL